jgi:hypothetical protein
MHLKAAPRFTRSKRALPEDAQLALDDEVRKIAGHPLVGIAKTGALAGVRVHKFKAGPRQLLVAYIFSARTKTVEFLDVGVHENFYRDLQGYMKARPK